MALSLRNLLFSILIAVSATVLAVGCGTDEYDPSAARSGEPVEAGEDRAVKDLNDTTVTSIDLSTSSEYIAEADEVNIFALVRDQNSRSLNELNAHNFTIRVDTHRSVDAGTVDLTTTVSSDNLVVLVIDSSGSMSALTETGETRMAVAKEAARLFVELMSPGDRTAIVDFDDAARTQQQLTDDPVLLNDAIDTFTASGATNLGAAMTEAVRAVGTRPGKRAAILLTDGDDTVDSVTGGPSVWLNNAESSRYQGLQLAQENDLIIYTVGLGDGLSDQGVDDLQTIAAETGGAYFPAPTATDLLNAFSSTIPEEVNALPPMETYQLAFPNPVPALPGQTVDVPYLLIVKYQNAFGIHRSVFDGTYTIQ